MSKYNYFYFGEKLGIGPVNTYVCEGGQLWLWGNNAYGQLGTNDVIAYSSPVQTVCGGSNWCMFDMGTYHTAAIKTDGSLWSWGLNLDGQLGDGTSITKSSPIQEYYNSTDWTCCAAGYNFTVASKNDNSLWGMGFNNIHQLGNLNTSSQSQPILIPLGASAGWRKVSAGKYHAAALDYDGVLYLWGGNEYGQCGTNSVDIVSLPSYPYADTIDFIDVACGDYFTLGLSYDNSVWAWGRNDQGQLGNISVGNISSPVQILSSYQIWAHVAAASDASAAMAFRLPSGATPTPTFSPSPSPSASSTPTPSPTPSESPAPSTPTPTPSDSPAVSSPSPTPSESPAPSTPTPTPTVANMNYLYTWGSNLFGEIGNNTRDVISGYSNPVYIDSGASEWKQIGPGVFMVSAIKNDGSLWAWGRNVFGQLGVNSVTDMSSPVQEITLSTDWLQTSCSGEGTGAIKTDGTLWLWGHNYGGQLAQNLDFLSLNGLSSPSQIYGGGTNWSQLSFGLGYNVGALKADGTLWCWGNNYFGQCGVNSDSNSFSSPVQEITGSTNWAYLSLGAYFTAALKNNGTIWCWGQNYAGNLGDNTAIDKSSPVQEYTASTWLSVSAGVNYVLAIKNDNTLWTWGANYDGQLGLNSDTAIPVSVPTQIGTESTWAYASAGNSTALAIKSDGSLWSWGYNQNGELGQNTSINPSSSPVQVAIFNNFWTWAGGESAGIRNAPIPTPSPT